MKNNKNFKVFLYTGICLVASILIILLAATFYMMAYTSSSLKSELVDIPLDNDPQSIEEYYVEVKNSMYSELKNLQLTYVALSLNSFESIRNNHYNNMELVFSRYKNSFGEGGRIEYYKVYIDTNKKVINAYDYYEGASKSESGIGDKEITDFDKLKYESYLNDALPDYEKMLKSAESCNAVVDFINNDISNCCGVSFYCDDLRVYNENFMID